MRPARLNPLMKDASTNVVQNHARILSGNVAYGSVSNTDTSRNINGVWATGTTPVAPNTPFTVDHVLGRVPVGFHTVRINAAGTLYDSGVTWTSTTISLKCSVASAAYTIFIF
jgi:hypothetical protein